MGKFRELIFARDGGYCVWCGRKGSDLAHLRHYGAGRKKLSGILDEPKNACVLCHDCHMKNHAGQSPTRKELEDLLSRRYGYSYEDAEM